MHTHRSNYYNLWSNYLIYLTTNWNLRMSLKKKPQLFIQIENAVHSNSVWILCTLQKILQSFIILTLLKIIVYAHWGKNQLSIRKLSRIWWLKNVNFGKSEMLCLHSFLHTWNLYRQQMSESMTYMPKVNRQTAWQGLEHNWFLYTLMMSFNPTHRLPSSRRKKRIYFFVCTVQLKV